MIALKKLMKNQKLLVKLHISSQLFTQKTPCDRLRLRVKKLGLTAINIHYQRKSDAT